MTDRHLSHDLAALRRQFKALERRVAELEQQKAQLEGGHLSVSPELRSPRSGSIYDGPPEDLRVR